MAGKKFNALPGFGLTMGFTMFYLSVIVLIPIAGLFLRVSEAGWHTQSFTDRDVRNPEALADKLKTHEDPISALVWDRLSDATRQQLLAYNGTESETVQTLRTVREALNQALRGSSLYDQQRFADVNLADEVQWIRQKHPGRVLRLNRLLLESAYSDSVQHRESWFDFWSLATSARAVAAYRVTFGASLVAAVANVIFGALLAWVLVRYRFPGRRLIDGIVDFPFALPTAVAGLTLADLFAKNGWLGRYLVPLGIEGAYSWLGIVIALTFVGMPFVVRTLQPVLEGLERDVEEVSATLGAGRLRTFVSVIAPALLPAMLTGFSLAFARAIGEYGSIVFISSNMPFKTEIAPYLIVMQLDQFNYTGAIALAVVLLVFSFVLLIAINLLEQWASRFIS